MLFLSYKRSQLCLALEIQYGNKIPVIVGNVIYCSPPSTVLDFLDGAIILRDNVDNFKGRKTTR